MILRIISAVVTIKNLPAVRHINIITAWEMDEA